MLAVVDVAGRPYCVHEGEPEGQQYVVIGGHYVGSLTRHVLESFAFHAQIALHVRVLGGHDPTTSSRPSSRRWRALCVPRSPATPGSRGSRARRVRSSPWPASRARGRGTGWFSCASLRPPSSTGGCDEVWWR